MVVAAAGSFAAFSTLVGSPLIAAFILMEAIGLGGPMLGTVLVPGLVAAGIGTLIFVAACTERLKLGTTVLILGYRPPVQTAKLLATLDTLSEGRTILGVGVDLNKGDSPAPLEAVVIAVLVHDEVAERA